MVSISPNLSISDLSISYFLIFFFFLGRPRFCLFLFVSFQIVNFVLFSNCFSKQFIACRLPAFTCLLSVRKLAAVLRLMAGRGVNDPRGRDHWGRFTGERWSFPEMTYEQARSIMESLFEDRL